jgi:hypothetical protein
MRLSTDHAGTNAQRAWLQGNSTGGTHVSPMSQEARLAQAMEAGQVAATPAATVHRSRRQAAARRLATARQQPVSLLEHNGPILGGLATSMYEIAVKQQATPLGYSAQRQPVLDWFWNRTLK